MSRLPAGHHGHYEKGPTMKKPHLVSVAAVLSLALAGSATAGLITPELAAASPASFDQWPGNVVIDYQAPDGQQATNLQDYLSDPVPSVSSIFNAALTTDSAGICNQIEQQVAIQAGQAVPLKAWHCTIPGSGDLQAAQPAANNVGLTYLVDGNFITFNYAGVPGGATVNATFDMEFTLSLNFAGQVIAGSGTPVDVVSSSLGLSNAHFSSKNKLLNAFGGNKLKQADAAMNSYTVSPATNVLNLDPEIATINSQILAAVGPLIEDVAPNGSWCGLGGCPNQPGQIASPLFDLSVTVDASNLNLVFSRGAVPAAAPVGCAFGSSSANPPATIFAECAPNQPAGVTDLELLQEQNGAWSSLGVQASSGWDPSSLDGVPIGSWEPNAGPVTAYAPWMQGQQLPGSGSTVELTVCSFNEWGSVCDPATSFTLQSNAVSNPPTGAGGGGGNSGPPPIKGRCGSGGVCRIQ